MTKASWIIVIILCFCSCTKAEVPDILPVHCLTFSPDGSFLATGGGKLGASNRPWDQIGEIRVWETKNWKKVLHTRERFTAPVYGVFFPSDSIISCVSSKIIRRGRGNPSDGFFLRSWDLKNISEAKPVHIKSAAPMDQAIFSPSTNLLAIVSGTCHIVYNVKKEIIPFSLEKHASWGFSFSPNGKKLLSCAQEEPNLRIYDTENGKLLISKTLAQSYIGFAQFSPDGKNVVAVSGDKFDHSSMVWMDSGKGKIYILQPDLAKVLVTIDSPYSYRNEKALAFSPDSCFFCVKSGFSSVKLIETKTGKMKRSFEETEAVNCLAFSPNGKWLAIGFGGEGTKGGLHIWDVEKGTIIQKE